MRKSFHTAIIFALVCVWCGCANQQKLSDSLNENNMSLTELIQNTADNKTKVSVFGCRRIGIYAADKDSATNIKKLLQDKKDIIQIACAYQTIALLHQDGTAETIDLDD